VKFRVILSDAAAYVLKVATALKVLYPHLLHITCLGRRLKRAEQIQGNYLEVNNLKSGTKKMFVKVPHRFEMYKDKLPDVLLPPEPILTR
jgi:hypothetical protein